VAVVFDAVGPSSAGTGVAGTSSSWSHTCSGSSRLLIVGVAIGKVGDGSATTSATYNGVAMTSVVGRVESGGAGQSDGYVQMFYLLAPATGANTVLVSCTQSVDITGGSVSFTGVDQTVPLVNITTNANITASASVSNMVVDAVCCGSGFNLGSGQTMRWLKDFNSATAAGSSAQSTAAATGTVSMNYSVNSDNWGIIGASVNSIAPVQSVATVAWFSA